MVAFIEAPLALLEEQVEALPGYPVEPAQMTLRLVPEILNSIDMIMFVGKSFGVVDPDVVEAGDVQGVVAGETVGVDDAVRLYHTLHDRQQGGLLGIGNHHRINPARALQQAENRHFACGTTATFTLAHPAEIALVHLDLTGERTSLLHLVSDQPTQPGEKGSSRVPMDAHQLSGGSGCGSGHKVLQQPITLARTEPTLTLVHMAASLNHSA